MAQHAPTTTPTDDNAAARAALLAELDITYTATFVPLSVSRNANQKEPTLNWRLSLKRNGAELATDYSQGIAHLPGYKQTRYNSTDVAIAIRASAETGRTPKGYDVTAAEWRGGHYTRTVPIPPPALVDVMYSLVSDADAAEYPFEEWADNYGYDTDSRKAEASYRQCIDISIRLRRILGGGDVLAQLTRLYEGY